jgi:hypothetical protein
MKKIPMPKTGKMKSWEYFLDKIHKSIGRKLGSGTVNFKDAQLQVIRNDYAKCAEQRDEFKHQLNAANREIKALKEIIHKNEKGNNCRF